MTLFTYCIIGLIWTFVHDCAGIDNMTNSIRIRLFLFWPITVLAFILGLIQAITDTFK
jgi:hypothetical protein